MADGESCAPEIIPFFQLVYGLSKTVAKDLRGYTSFAAFRSSLAFSWKHRRDLHPSVALFPE